jgi:hypothetical protein
MTQPTFVPIAEADQVRPARHLHVPGSWTPSHPAELRTPRGQPRPAEGTPGPDSGFALRLAHRFGPELKLGVGESEHDVVLGVALIASKRAAIFGRAPSVYDVRHALMLWCFLDGHAPAALLQARRAAFSAVSHDYVAQRELVDAVPDDVLRLSPEEAHGRGGAAPA